MKDKTPNEGVNLCEIDPYEVPPDNLTKLGRYTTPQMARMAAKTRLEDDPNQKLILIFPDGHGEDV